MAAAATLPPSLSLSLPQLHLTPSWNPTTTARTNHTKLNKSNQIRGKNPRIDAGQTYQGAIQRPNRSPRDTESSQSTASPSPDRSLPAAPQEGREDSIWRAKGNNDIEKKKSKVGEREHTRSPSDCRNSSLQSPLRKQ